MPYSYDNPPSKIRNLSKKKQRQWISVFNDCYNDHHDDAKCHKMAWGVTNKCADCAADTSAIDKVIAIAALNKFIYANVPHPLYQVANEAPKDSPQVDDSVDAGVKATARELGRLFGGYKGGVRLSPSVSRPNAHHVTVFSETAASMGGRMTKLRNHLLANGYSEISEGVFQNGKRMVYNGRAYSRRGKKPLAFMFTVEVK